MFRAIADLEVAGQVYAEGWQSWSPVRIHRAGEVSERAPDERAQKTEWRPDKPVAEGVIQAEGVLVVAPPDGPARAWFSPRPSSEVATLRAAPDRDRLVISADGPVEQVQGADLAAVLAAVGDRLGVRNVAHIPPGWCSWSYYFKHVTEADVMENVDAVGRLSLPIEIVQLDDGYEADIGDWLEVRPGFGSLERVADRVREAGMLPGIWTAPFLVGPGSTLATRRPEWLVADSDAGTHWNRPMRILDVTHPAAAEHLTNIFRTFAGWGFSYYKLDFLYAGAIPGLDAYREGMRLIRDAVGSESIILACGAPILPSIGLCDAMRVGPDVLQETPDAQLDVENLVWTTGLRRWMNGRLWVNDPDHLVARPEIKDREAWAAHLEGYGGQAFSSDRLSILDRRGLELTRRFLGASRSRRER